jgi:uncharacterized protein YdbL (DUF1318 family)
MRWNLALVSLCAFLAACVTINIYFPAAAAERAADQVIDQVWGRPDGDQPALPEAGDAPGPSSLLDLLVSPAAAQADVSVSTPAIRRLTAAMQARHPRLAPHYDSGALGLTRDGLLTVRDPGAVPMAQRTEVNGLVAEENRDRQALYREIAGANGHPEWEADIRSTFARRWVDRARTGWWYQDEGGRWVWR